jgi:Asp-tRNA(Asn)/Glu-tRNA(Gln) amidotransferase A subunit family amidase
MSAAKDSLAQVYAESDALALAGLVRSGEVSPAELVEAAIAVIKASGLRHEVGALGTTLEGEADEVWATLRAAHEAMIAAGATGGLSHFSSMIVPTPLAGSA